MSQPKAYFKVFIGVLLLCANGFASLEKPNVVVILADDFGLGDVGRDHTARTGNAPLAPTPQSTHWLTKASGLRMPTRRRRYVPRPVLP